MATKTSSYTATMRPGLKQRLQDMDRALKFTIGLVAGIAACSSIMMITYSLLKETIEARLDLGLLFGLGLFLTGGYFAPFVIIIGIAASLVLVVASRRPVFKYLAALLMILCISATTLQL